MNYRQQPTASRPALAPPRGDEVSAGPDHDVTSLHGDTVTVTPHSHESSAPEANGADTPVTEGADLLPAPEHNVKYKPSMFRPNGIVTLSTFQARDTVVSATSECNGDSTVTGHQSVTLSTSQSKADGTVAAQKSNGTVTPATLHVAPPSMTATVTRQVSYVTLKHQRMLVLSVCLSVCLLYLVTSVFNKCYVSSGLSSTSNT